MVYKRILVTGGAGFVGSAICIKLKIHYPSIEVVALDNLMRRGSELNIPRLKKYGVNFVHGDVRSKQDLDVGKIDLLVECSAEPSVMAGVTSSPEYLLHTNLIGAINCFEEARRKEADVIFLSTSRVYPIKTINQLSFIEKEKRFEFSNKQEINGASKNGISEKFSLDGIRSLYGTTKLAAELLLQEYRENYGIKTVINRFGLISGPWQMGKIDQGVIVLWIARHMFQKPLSYIGFDGSGKQVRDMLHVDDVFNCIVLELEQMGKADGNIYNVGGGLINSVSLLELTDMCQKITGKTVPMKRVSKTRQGDIKSYITDSGKITRELGWKQKKTIEETLNEIYQWISENEHMLMNILQ